jgi:hypothetical protein
MNDESVIGPVASGPCEPSYERPAFELIPLDCEITAYAPDGDHPLF